MALLLRFLPHLIVVAIVGILLAIVYGRGVSNERNRQEAVIAKLQAAWSEERAKAAEISAEQERKHRQQEQQWQAELSVEVMKSEQLQAAFEDLRRKSDASRNQLLGNITNLVKASGSAPGATTSCSHFQGRVETLGLLLAERDGMAGESEQQADLLRDRLSACRAFAEIVSKASVP